jgi:hypothetical protein
MLDSEIRGVVFRTTLVGFGECFVEFRHYSSDSDTMSSNSNYSVGFKNYFVGFKTSSVDS